MSVARQLEPDIVISCSPLRMIFVRKSAPFRDRALPHDFDQQNPGVPDSGGK